MKEQNLSQWLENRCKREHLSLRQAAAKTGLSHATIADIRKGGHPFPESIKKLAQAFGGDGNNERLALEDKLLVLAGYRTERPEEDKPSELLAQLMDKAKQLNDPQLEIIIRFAVFLTEVEGKVLNMRRHPEGTRRRKG